MTRKDWILCAASGCLAAAAFPPLGWWPLAWVAWVPLLVTVRRATPGAALRRGFLAGLVASLGTFHWIVVVVHTYGHAPMAFALLTLFLLAAYLALYQAAWAAGMALLGRRGEVFAIVVGACLWAALELLRTHLISGFPWALLANSQASFLPLIQISEWTGAFGVSFVVILGNLALGSLAGDLLEGRAAVRAWVRLSALALVIALVVAAGAGRKQGIETRMQTRRPLVVALVQGNIPQDVKWDPAFVLGSLQRHVALTADAAERKPDLVLWPEAATTFFFQDGEALSKVILDASESAGAPIFFGSSAYEPDGGGPARALRYYNSAFLVRPGGRRDGRYDKIHLVPFGEYVPFRRLLPFLSRVATGIASGDFTPGAEPSIFSLDGRRFGALICYEGIFPELSRDLVNHGADLLVNITKTRGSANNAQPAPANGRVPRGGDANRLRGPPTRGSRRSSAHRRDRADRPSSR
jgi:apolipoprotein N-acyltransferase